MVFGHPVQLMKFKCVSHPQDLSSEHIIEQHDCFALMHISIVPCFDVINF